MSELSPRLGLPFLMAAQAQKHVTHNEALVRLDALVQPAVQDFGAETPPDDPAEGQLWALGPVPTGAWAGQGGDLALWFDGEWQFITPAPGWHAASGTALRVFDGAGWLAPDLPDLQNLPGLGINASHDPTNRLTVAAPATLLNHEGAGHRLKLNKATPADTASLLFQTGFSGRAEMGTAGSDDFAIKVSPDGTTWFDALTASRSTGVVSLPNGLNLAAPLPLAQGGTGAASAPAARTALGLGTAATATATTSNTDTTTGRLLKTGDHGIAGPSANLSAGADLLLARNLRGGLYAARADQVLGLPDTLSYVHNLLVLNGIVGGTRRQSFLTARTGSGRKVWFGWEDGSNPDVLWSELVHQHNLLGTVSQAGGVPTGAVIQRGSNANGEFVRFADGTQICTHSASASIAIDTAHLGGFRSAGQGWTYPSAFAAAPAVSVTARNLTAFGGISANTPGTSAMQWAVTAITTQTAAAREVALVATGRWF